MPFTHLCTVQPVHLLSGTMPSVLFNVATKVLQSPGHGIVYEPVFFFFSILDLVKCLFFTYFIHGNHINCFCNNSVLKSMIFFSFVYSHPFVCSQVFQMIHRPLSINVNGVIWSHDQSEIVCKINVSFCIYSLLNHSPIFML